MKEEHRISPRAQKFLVLLAVFMATAFGLAWGFLIKMFPLPPATWTPVEVARYYQDHAVSIRVGATICGWTSGFFVPLAVVTSAQMTRMEKGWPIWSVTQFAGAILTSIFLVLPAALWGVAAYRPDRDPGEILILHDIVNLLLTTTDQYFIFMMFPVAYVAIKYGKVAGAPLPRWFGYLTITCALLLEPGALGYLAKTGPFAWNGLFVFWIPTFAFATWLNALVLLLLKAIARQQSEAAIEARDKQPQAAF